MYGKNWDRFYQSTYDKEGGKSLWDVDPSQAVALDLVRFDSFFNNSLPILDIGCGTGRQTEFLSTRYKRTVGIDASKLAIDLALNSSTNANTRYHVCDLCDPSQSNALYNQYGEMNLYIRGVLHQILPMHFGLVSAALRKLTGEAGRIYCIEVSKNIHTYFNDSNERFRDLPSRMKRVFISHLPPKGIDGAEIAKILPPKFFKELASGETCLHTNLTFTDGSIIQIPAYFVIMESNL